MSESSNRDESVLADWTAVVRSVERAQHALSTRLDELGMTLPYFSVLTLLLGAEDQRLPMSRIARDLAMTSGGFTKLADRMARDGLIDRRGSSGDRRVVFAALTDDGRRQARQAVGAIRSFLSGEVLQLISREELATMAGLGRRLDALGEEPDETPSFELGARPAGEPERRSRG